MISSFKREIVNHQEEQNGAKLSALRDSSVHGQPRGYNVLNLNSLATAIKKTANPTDNKTTDPKVDEFID